jgi:putative ABC transport system permease protein
MPLLQRRLLEGLAVIGHYINLALRNIRRNIVLSSLITMAVALGIGGFMSTYAVFRAIGTDPVPGKSGQLFAPLIDNVGPNRRESSGDINAHVTQLTFRDARELMRARAAPQQAALYPTAYTVIPEGSSVPPFSIIGHAVYADFFRMFNAPFQSGSPWGKAEDEQGANVVVISSALAEHLYHGADPIGRTLHLNKVDYRVIGVLAPWSLPVRIFDLNNGSRIDSRTIEEVFEPFQTPVNRAAQTPPDMNFSGKMLCGKAAPPDWLGLFESECLWVQFWVDLPTAADVERYRQFLDHYANEQQRVGRFDWPALTRLRNVRDWMNFMHVIPDGMQAAVTLSFGFLIVCLLNAIGLILSKLGSRTSEMTVRRALGATKLDIFLQFTVESAVLGVAGGVLGLVLTAIALSGERAISPSELLQYEHLNLSIVVITITSAILATIVAGLYPAWRAASVESAWRSQSR